MTESEQKLLEIIRELKPFERIEVQKDQLGRPDYYIVTRTQKVMLS